MWTSPLSQQTTCSVAGHLRRNEIKRSVNKGQRISRFVEELSGVPAEATPNDISTHPCYLGFFRCWNEQRYYEAHDVLEHLWLRTQSEDANYFKGLIQAAGGFVHLQKQYARPTHPKDGRRLYPAVRLFRLAEKNLAPYLPMRHRFDIESFLGLLAQQVNTILGSNHRQNPWSPESAPKIELTQG
jgi:predicted metal-dependent hydrolase